MGSNPSDDWSSPRGTRSFADTFSPSRQSYTSRSDSQRFSSDGEDSEQHTRRLNISPSPSQQNDYEEDAYTDDNSIDEVDAALHNLDESYDDTEQHPSQWSPGSYGSTGPTFSSATGTFTYSGSYTGSPSFVSLPTFSPRSPLNQPVDPRARLSRITERTEESRPTSMAVSSASRPLASTPDNLRRSALLGGGTTSHHSRSSTEPNTERGGLPVPGRLGELIAVFESQSPTTSHSRAASTPGYRSSSPMFGTNQSVTTGYGYGSTSYGFGSRPSSPSKSAGSSGSYTGPDTRSTLISPPVRPTTSSGFRSSATGSAPQASYTSPSYTATPSGFSNANTWTDTNTATQTGDYTTPNTESKAYTEETFSRNTVTPTGTLRKPQTSPRSPLASVRNIVALWKERTPGSRTERSAASSVSPSSPPPPPPPPHDDDGRYGVRRRVDSARARMRESRGAAASAVTPSRPTSQDLGDNASLKSGRSGTFPPGFDLNEFSAYSQSKEPPTHIGLLWYLNVHASPPYRWQRCQALLYPHMLLLSWLAPGGGRGIVALDLLNCTSVQSAPSPTHPSARDDVGTMAAKQQTGELDAQPLMDMLVPFHMMYADGVERLAAESLLERQKWVNRIWEAVNKPVAVPDSVSVTRSPTSSIRTIMTIESSHSHSSNGSQSTVFVPPLSSIPDISDYNSSPSGLSRQSSIVSSHHSRTVDDTVIRNQEYVYPGDSRVITPQRGSSLRRSGSMTDLDDEFKNAITRSRASAGLFGSPVTISSGSSLGRNIFVTPPPSTGRGSDRRSDLSDENFFSAGSDGARSNVSSTYFSQTSLTSTGAPRTMAGVTTATSETQVTASSPFTTTYLRSDSGSDVSFADSPSTLSRARVIRRRVVSSSRMHTSGYQTDASRSSSDKENQDSAGSRTPTGSQASYTPDSRSRSLSGSEGHSGESYSDERSRTPTGSYTGSYTGSGRSRSRSRSGSRSGSYTGSESVSVRSGGGSGRSGSRTGSGSQTGTGTGSFTPGSYTVSGGFTPDSGSFTLQGGSNGMESSSGVSVSAGGHTPVSSSETGYDICPSSDFTDLTRSAEQSMTPSPFTPAISATLSDVASEKYITASVASTEYETAAIIQSDRASITSFESLPTISDYLSAPSISSYRTASEVAVGSDYRTASEPSEPSRGSVYASAGEPDLEEIPSESQLNTPVLSSLRLGSEPDEDRSVFDIPTHIPSMSPSVISELLPEEIPLPHSAQVSIAPGPQPLPSLSPSPSTRSLSITPRPVSDRTPSLASSPPLPPLPSSPGSSPSFSLSATPSPFGPSTEERDVVTPTSLHLPEDDESEDISVLASLPPSTLGSTSVITPTSIAISSPSTASTLPPSTQVIPPTAPSSISISTTLSLSTFTATSSSGVPQSPQPWATATDVSYESSILQPSPSVRSIALHEGMETSFETSFLRPSGSPSSVGRMSTIPPSPMTRTATVAPHSPLPALTPVPVLPPSLSSPTDVGTPTSLDFTSESSSLGRTGSLLSTISYTTESSMMSTSILSSDMEDLEPEEEPIEVPDISTEPSLVSTISPHHSPTPSPIAGPSLPTPTGSIIVSISTPHGSGETQQSSLRTMPSISAVTERDLGRDFEHLVDEVRTYDQARGLEHQELADNVKALRDELRGLADYLQRTPSPRTPPFVVTATGAEETPRRRIQLVDRPVGESTVMSAIYPGGPRYMEVTIEGGLSRNASSVTATSMASYLSSHHSDEDLLDEADQMSSRSPEMWHSEEEMSTETITSSSDIVSSPETESSELTTSTARQEEAPNALEQALRGIQDQLRALEDGQNSAKNLLDALQARPTLGAPDDHTAELKDRLERIESLIQAIADQEHPRGPVFPVQPEVSRTPSISESTDSLRRLRSILHDLASPRDMEGPHMPLPSMPAAGLSVAQQLDDILSSAHQPPTTGPPEVPRVNPFVYRPSERGARARSASPSSMETLPRRPQTVPIPYPVLSQGRRPQRPTRQPARQQEFSEPETTTQPSAPLPHPEPTEAERVLNEQRIQRDTQQPVPPRRPFHHGPAPQPVFPGPHDPARATTAPPGMGGQEGRPPPTSWYRQPQGRPQTQRPSAGPSQTGAAAPGEQKTGDVRYMPMPAGPTVVNLPPVFDSLIEILRENRLAQLATVDQQRELMRYMRGLNEWLERDVHDRQNEIRGVYARVDQLSHDIRGIQRGRRPLSESSDPSEVEFVYPTAPVQPMGPYPGLPAGFQPFSSVQQHPVIPNVIPDDTPPPGFPPVMPQPQPQPTIIVNPGQVIPSTVPFVPRDEYHPGGPGRQPTPHSRTEQPFIPPDDSRSTGTPRPPLPHPMPPSRTFGSGMGPNVIQFPESPDSTGSASTPRRSPSTRYGRHGGRRPTRSSESPRSRSRSRPRDRYSSRSRRSPRRGRSRSRSRSRSPTRSHVPLVITNPSMMQPPTTPGMQPSSYQPSVHVVPPSAASSSPERRGARFADQQPPPQQQQPTIIIQQPAQQAQQPIVLQPPPSPHPTTSDFGRHMTHSPMPGMSEAGMPMGMPMSGMPMTGVPMTGMPGVPMTGMPGVPMTGMPGVPMTGMPGMPMTGMPMTAMPGAAPMIIQQRSRSSSRSRSRSRDRHRTPVPTQPTQAPVIIDRRSRSRSPRQTVLAQPMPAGVTVLPSQGVGMGGIPPGVVMMPHRSRSGSRGRRSRSRSRDRIVVQPQAPPTIYPQAPTQVGGQPAVILPGGVPGMIPGMGMAPVILPHRRSRSSSRRRHGSPIIIPPQQQSRYRDRRSSDSPGRRYGRSPSRYDYRERSPRRHERSPSYGYGRPHRYAEYSSRYPSRSPPRTHRSRSPPRSRSRRSRSPSPRSPPRSRSHYPPTSYPPTAHPTERPPTVHQTGYYPSHPRSRSISPPRHGYHPSQPRSRSGSPPRPRSPQHIRVVTTRRSPRRDRSRPRYTGRSITPESEAGRHRPRSPGRRGGHYTPRSRSPAESDPRRSISSPPPRRYAPRRGRTPSPVSSRGRTPVPTRRGPRSVSPVSRPQSYGRRSMSAGASPPRTLPPRRPTQYAPTDEDAGRPEVRITVPSRTRTGETRRPPTVMTLESDGERRPTRTGTPGRPSGGYSPPRSIYSPPPGVHVVPAPHTEESEGERSITPPARTSTRPPTRAHTVSGSQGDRPALPPGETPHVLAEVPGVVQPIPVHPGVRDAAVPPVRPGATTPMGYPPIEDPRPQIEALNDATERLQMTVAAAERAEDQRDSEFRQEEDDRRNLFLAQEAQRNEEARQRAEAIWADLESRLATLPPIPGAAAGEKPMAPGEGPADDIASIATQAATQHASDVMEMIRLEREEFAKEREEMAQERAGLLEQLRAEKDNVIEEKDHRIRALEEELTQLRSDFEAEKEQRMNEEAEMRERDRAERIERDESMRTQLGDITELVQEQRDLCETKKVVQDQRWEEKQARRLDKESQMIELRDMIQKIHDDMEVDRARGEEDKRESKDALERIIEDLQRQNGEQRELLQSLSDSWRADCERHHEETIDAVKSTADKQVPFNVQGYLDEFSQALATEVRMLLGEVGKIREERRALQHEIGDLLCMKAKYGPGGEYEPDWRPPGPPPPPESMGPPPPPDPPTVPVGIKPAWRTVHQRPKKKKKQAEQPPVASTSHGGPPPQHIVQQQYGHGDVRQQLTGSWAAWQPDRNAVTPPSVEPTLMVPGRESPGLFGPRTPSTGSMYAKLG